MPETSHPPDADPVLTSERKHLATSRAALARMRDKAAAMDAAAAADWVSRQFLESAQARRLQALADDPTVPLFFGRLDYRDDHPAEPGARFHIGRRHVSDDRGDPLVVDWRAPVSLPFYRGSRAEPYGVHLRRRYGYHRGELTAFEDEELDAPAQAGDGDHAGAADAAHSAILEAEIERPRVGPMRDIVATIQPEQDVIVRAGLDASICVQGAPGTGKTAVGLHRAAYLLYAHRDQLTRQGVLVVGPNASFLRYIGDVLPALGEIDATQTTVEELTRASLLRSAPAARPASVEDAALAVLKGDARMAVVIERALWAHVTPPDEALVVPRGARRWRVPVYRVEELLDELRRRGVRYGAARAMLPQRLAHAVLVAMENAGDSPDDRVQDAVARSAPVKALVKQIWPAVDAAALVHRLLSDAEVLARAADGVLDHDEQALLLSGPSARSVRARRWSVADTVLVDEAADLLERTTSLGHVVVDEAQDLSPMMLRAVGRRCSTGSATVLGDLAQATTPWASRDWTVALGHLGQDGAHVEQLTLGFRVPGEVIEYAARLLPVIAPGLEPPRSVRRARGELGFRLTAPDAVPAAVVTAVREALERPGSVGVIAADARIPGLVEALEAATVPHAVLGQDGQDGPTEPTDPAGPDATPGTDRAAGAGGEAASESGLPAPTEFDVRLDVVPASLAKGLEFDHVVLVEPAEVVAGEPDEATGLRRLYVCLTRAVTSLLVVHAHDLPEQLGQPEQPRQPALSS